MATRPWHHRGPAHSLSLYPTLPHLRMFVQSLLNATWAGVELLVLTVQRAHLARALIKVDG